MPQPQRTYRESPHHPDPIPEPIPPWIAPAVVTRYKKRDDPAGDQVIDRFASALTIAREAATRARSGHVTIMGDPMRTKLANLQRARKNAFHLIEPALREFDSSRKAAEAAIGELEAAMTPRRRCLPRKFAAP